MSNLIKLDMNDINVLRLLLAISNPNCFPKLYAKGKASQTAVENVCVFLQMRVQLTTDEPKLNPDYATYRSPVQIGSGKRFEWNVLSKEAIKVEIAQSAQKIKFPNRWPDKGRPAYSTDVNVQRYRMLNAKIQVEIDIADGDAEPPILLAGVRDDAITPFAKDKTPDRVLTYLSLAQSYDHAKLARLLAKSGDDADEAKAKKHLANYCKYVKGGDVPPKDLAAAERAAAKGLQEHKDDCKKILAAYVNVVDEECAVSVPDKASARSSSGRTSLDQQQEPAPVASDIGEPIDDVDKPTDRKSFTASRIIRDSSLSRQVKAANGYQCQLCGGTIALPDGKKYAEAHHLRPLGGEHKGPDKVENMICVCPNCHAKLDFGAMKLDISQIINGDAICVDYIQYHNDHIYQK